MDHPGLIRVMVVDDDPDDLERVARLLLGVVGDSDLPAFVLANAGSRDKALQAWQGGLQVDICLIDWRLDQGDGLELAKRLQAAGCTAPMVFLTWHADPGFDRAAMRAGALDFLPKAETSASSLARTLRHAVLASDGATVELCVDAAQAGDRPVGVAMLGAGAGPGLMAELRERSARICIIALGWTQHGDPLPDALVPRPQTRAGLLAALAAVMAPASRTR